MNIVKCKLSLDGSYFIAMYVVFLFNKIVKEGLDIYSLTKSDAVNCKLSH